MQQSEVETRAPNDRVEDLRIAEAKNGRPVEAKAAPVEVKKSSKRPFAILGILVAGGLIAFGAYTVSTAGQESTDDAQVTADVVAVSSRVTGQVVEVSIKENQLVKAGEQLARIDDSDFVAKVKQAEAEVASTKAQAASADAQVSIVEATSKGTLSSAKAAYSGSSVGVASADAAVAGAQAQLVRAQADQRKADADLKRTKELREANALPQERLDNAQSAFDSAQAQVTAAQAQVAAAQEGKRAAQSRVSEAAGVVTQSAPIDSQMAAVKANADLAHARTDSAEALLELAKLQLSYTKIVAPYDGVASKLSVHGGQFVTVGQPVIELVPTATYVVANFKETQLSKMAVGQKAKLEIDSYPHREFEGTVESISGGTGASFSIMPADNASGNFVKVVQRVPVRIAWVNLPADVKLRAGLSVDATVFGGK